MDDKLPMKTAKFMSLKNLYVYVTYIYIAMYAEHEITVGHLTFSEHFWG